MHWIAKGETRRDLRRGSARRVRLCLGAALLLFVGCGGRTDVWREEGSNNEALEEDPHAQQTDAQAAGNDTIGPDGTTTDEEWQWDSQPLGACEKGKLPQSGPCDWLAEGRCYATKDEACDCICPRDRETLCLSGFWDGPDSQTRVHCK